MMMPSSGQKGQLEDLLLRAAYNAATSLKISLDSYCSAVVTPAWSDNRQSKMRLRVLMASHYLKPTLKFEHAWELNVKPSQLMPVNDPCFDPIVSFLAGLP